MKFYQVWSLMCLMALSLPLFAEVSESQKLKIAEKLIRKNYPGYSVNEIKLKFDTSHLYFPVMMVMGSERAWEIYNWVDDKKTSLDKIEGRLIKDGQMFSFQCSVVINQYSNAAGQAELESHFQDEYFLGSGTSCRIKNLKTNLSIDMKAEFFVVENEYSKEVEAQPAYLRSLYDSNRRNGKAINERIEEVAPAKAISR